MSKANKVNQKKAAKTMISTVKCPRCSNELDVKPTKILENNVFTIEAYECDKCHNKFKVFK